MLNLSAVLDNARQNPSSAKQLRVVDASSEGRVDHITRLAARVFDCAHAFIFFEDAEHHVHKSVVNFKEIESLIDQAFCEHLLVQESPFVVEDTLANPLFAQHPLVLNKPNIRFFAGITLSTQNTENVGFLCVLDNKPRTMNAQNLSLLADLATTVETELNRQIVETRTSTLRAEHQEKAEQSKVNRLTNNILEKIAYFDTLPPILQSIVENIELEYPQHYCSILLLDDSLNHLVLGAAPSLPDFYNEAIEGIEIGIGVGSCGTAAASGERVIVEDISQHPYWAPWVDLAAMANLGACWSQPIKNSDGSVIGTFAIYQKLPSIPTRHEIERIRQFSHLTSIAIERQRFNEVIWRQANFDELTKLPNRSIMKEYLKKAMTAAKRNNTKLALMFLDLDNFKDINDTLGHGFGDELLIDCAKRIKNSIRDTDTLARLGGDEFIIIIDDINDLKGVKSTVNKVLKALSDPYCLQDEVVHTSASIGITVYPDDATDIEGLLKNADQAMYGAKSTGKNNYQYYTKGMREAAMHRMGLVADLRQALEKNQFYITYQPIVDVQTGTINKAEALIRWQHPERGIVGPLDFIPLAEETGLIIDISNWVFEQVCKDVKHWRKIANPDLQISINTSPIHYTDPERCITDWLNLLLENKTPPGAILLEITENLLMDANQSVSTKLFQFRQAGIEIALDDFGTGYSSISYLKKYPSDYLKIDKSFVHSMSEDSNDMVLCEAIIVMSKKLGIKVVAEGIETEEQRLILEKIGCEYGQGYLFSSPLKDQDFETLLLEQKPSKKG